MKNNDKVRVDVDKIKKGQKVEYGFFTDIVYLGLDEKGQVVLRDSNGNIKKVYKWLFEKYARAI